MMQQNAEDAAAEKAAFGVVSNRTQLTSAQLMQQVEVKAANAWKNIFG
jgi:hypothetical protein